MTPFYVLIAMVCLFSKLLVLGAEKDYALQAYRQKTLLPFDVRAT